MQLTTFAAIDVGSNEVSMKIYEVSKKDQILELDHVRHTIELGADTYSIGYIRHVLVDELCNTLIGFTKKMDEYSVRAYSACATSAIREAQNYLLILDQIHLRSKLKVKILSNSEQRFLLHKAIALKENDFHTIVQKGTVIVDVGAGSIQLSIFSNGRLLTTQNIKLGSLRLRELISDLECPLNDYTSLISEYIDNDIATFYELSLRHIEIKHIIAIGENLTEFVRNSFELFRDGYYDTWDHNEDLSECHNLGCDRINRSDFSKFYQQLLSTPIDYLSHALGIPKEQAVLVIPTSMIFYKIFTMTNAEFMWLPGSTLCDGIVADYAERKSLIHLSHEFHQDIIWAARYIASKYQCNPAHFNYVEKMSLFLFDELKKLHGLSKRDRLLLQIASILHSCGEFINMSDSAKNSYNIIMASEIIGLSHNEREMVASIVKYHSDQIPSTTDHRSYQKKGFYITMCKLTAILKIANALDKSHKQKFNTIKVTIKENEMIMLAKTMKDISLEQGLIAKKAYFFEEVYGIRPILKHKKEYLL